MRACRTAAALLKIHRARIFLSAAAAAVLMALLRRTLTAFSTRQILEWDETYYASIASTAAAGLGLYPHVQGYPPMPVMGGIGYAAYLYVLAFEVFGASIFGMRLMSLLAAVGGLAGLYVASARWYGRAAGVVAVVVAAASFLFNATNTSRMDAFTFAFVAWLLAVLALAVDRPEQRRWAVLTGVVAALGLQVHLHTTAAALACACVFAGTAWHAARRTNLLRAITTGPLAAFVLGYACGAALFIAVNVLPAPQSFIRTAGLTRIAMHDGASYASGTLTSGQVAASFGSPVRVLRKESGRYALLLDSLPSYEVVLWLAAILPLLWIRAHPRDGSVRLLLAGAIVGAAIVVNGASPLYASHTWPILLLPVVVFITHGFTGRERVGWRDVHGLALLFVTCVALMEASRLVRVASHRQQQHAAAPPPAVVAQVRNMASRACHLAGDTSLYVPHFMDYPKFTGTRETEVRIGSTYFDVGADLVRYWELKQPDVVFGPLAFGLSEYVRRAGYVDAGGVWIKPGGLSEGCEIAGVR